MGDLSEWGEFAARTHKLAHVRGAVPLEPAGEPTPYWAWAELDHERQAASDEAC